MKPFPFLKKQLFALCDDLFDPKRVNSMSVREWAGRGKIMALQGCVGIACAQLAQVSCAIMLCVCVCVFVSTCGQGKLPTYNDAPPLLRPSCETNTGDFRGGCERAEVILSFVGEKRRLMRATSRLGQNQRNVPLLHDSKPTSR